MRTPALAASRRIGLAALAVVTTVLSSLPAHAAVETDPDLVPPEIIVTPDRPAPGGWYGASVSLTAIARDNRFGDSGVRSFGYTMTGAQSGSGTLPPTSGGVFDVVEEGVTQFVFSATDNAFNDATLDVDVRIDRTKPTASISSPARDMVVAKGDELTMTYGCGDTLSGVAGCAGTVPNGAKLFTGEEGSWQVSVAATDRAGNQEVVERIYRVVSGFILTRLPSIQGESRLGARLRAVPAEVVPAPETEACAWFRDEVRVADDVPEYSPTPDDVGHDLTLRCTFTRANLPTFTASTAPVRVMPGRIGEVVTTPQVSGEGRVGSLLGVDYQVGVPLAGESWVTSVRWTRDGAVIGGATEPTYVVQPEDHGHSISAVVRAEAPGHEPRDFPAGNTVLISALRQLRAAGDPTIQGVPAVGSPLKVALPTVTPVGDAPAPPVTLDVAWLRDGQPIAGATAVTYTPSSADLGRQLSVRVTAGGSGFEPLVLQSGPTAAVGAPVPNPNPSPSPSPNPSPNPNPNPAPGDKASSRVVLRAKALGGSKVKLRVKVTAGGAAPTGKVTLRRGTTKLGTCTLRRGTCTVTLKRQRAGRTTYVARYGGTARVAPSSARTAVRVR